jgi:hypothetical protein
VGGVPMSDVFKVITAHPDQKAVPLLHKQRIETWRDKRFFAACNPASKEPILMAPASAVRNKFPDSVDPVDDLSHTLVTVVPMDAAVRITELDAVTTEASGLDGHYADVDLRRDILLHCHDCASHPGLADTMHRVRTLAWFPGMQKYVQYHVDSCAYCVAAGSAAPSVGSAVRCYRRLKLVEIDFKVLDAEVRARTESPAVLTIVDPVSGLTMFVPVPNRTAESAAKAIFVHWYPVFGVPAHLRYDGAAEFSSKVMHAFHRLVGVRGSDVSAPDNPTHHGTVERRNRVLEKCIDTAFSSGAIDDELGLELVCADATAKCNLEFIHRGATVFEYLTGEVPRTRNEVVTHPPSVEEVRVLNSDFLTMLQSIMGEKTSFLHYLRDDESRANTLRRDVATGSRRDTQFTLLEGDRVSYRGEPFTLVDFPSSLPGGPVKANIRAATHDGVNVKTVLYTDLRPLASPRPALLRRPPPGAKLTIGDFVFYSEPASAEVKAGVVTDLDGGHVTLHAHRQAPVQKRRFTPVYKRLSTGTLVTKARNHDDPAFEPVMHVIPRSHTMASGTIASFFIDDTLFATLSSLGVSAQ